MPQTGRGYVFVNLLKYALEREGAKTNRNKLGLETSFKRGRAKVSLNLTLSICPLFKVKVKFLFNIFAINWLILKLNHH